MFFRYIKLLTLLSLTGGSVAQSCKCPPDDNCWPSPDTWNALNTSVSGKLIHNIPPDISCYPGTNYDEKTCTYVYSQWSNSSFRSLLPVGYIFSADTPCLSVNISSGEKPKTCGLGPAPVYTIDATEPEEVAKGITFARKHNIRLIIRNTGHDLLGKSAGYGALQVWIKSIQKGITFHEKYSPSDQCDKPKWNSSAVTIAGGYVWGDVYDEAFKRNLTVVGGADALHLLSTCGYTQGGGHSRASHDYGLAADQVLEAQVVLADGRIVTANACQNSDLYFAIRGGGGGTYGVVTSMTIKSYASKSVVAHELVVTPLKDKHTDDLLAAISDIYLVSPDISHAGFSGYGLWSVNSPFPFYGNETTSYSHTLITMGQSLEEARTGMAPLLEKLEAYNKTSLVISSSWAEFPTYGAYHRAMPGVAAPASSSDQVTASRLLDKRALTGNHTLPREMINTIAGTPEQQTVNSVFFLGGEKVLSDGEDVFAGVNPAWRSAYALHTMTRGWPADSDDATAQSVKNDVAYTNIGAMRAVTPSMGSYMNEDDRHNPCWISDFFGTRYDRLLSIKQKYDPDGVFYCPKCVGSMQWHEQTLRDREYGPLCSMFL